MTEEQDKDSSAYFKALAWMADHRVFQWPDWANVPWKPLFRSDGGVNLDFTHQVGADYSQLDQALRAWRVAWVSELWAAIVYLGALLLILRFCYDVGGGFLCVVALLIVLASERGPNPFRCYKVFRALNSLARSQTANASWIPLTPASER